MSQQASRRVRELAREQAGVVSRQQALKAGMSVGEIYAKVKSGRWSPEHRGVYRTFTGPIERDARLWAAVLYVGTGARLSHGTAAELNGLTDRPDPIIQVKIPPGRRIVAPKGVMVHISLTSGPLWRPPRGLPPFTLPEETVIDLVHVATDLDDVIALVAGGFGKRLVSDAELRREAASRQRLRWRHDLEEIICECSGGTHSVLEYRHDRDVQRAHGLPPAKKQVPFRKADGTRGFHDRCYIEYRLVIELDGKRYHPDEQKGRDQDRDNAHAVTGSTLRYGWIDVTRKACETARQEADALRNRGWTGRLKPCSPRCRAVTTADQAVPPRQLA